MSAYLKKKDGSTSWYTEHVIHSRAPLKEF